MNAASAMDAALSVRTLSGSNLTKVGLGCSRIGSFNNPIPTRAIRELLAQSLDIGVNIFDTADIYGQGDSEREVGRAVAGRRDDVFVVTKVGKRFSARMRLLRPLKPLIKPLLAASGKGGQSVTARRSANLAGDFDARRLERAVDDSLRHLGMDAVDGLLLHSPPATVVRDPAVGQLLERLRQAGKVRHYGVSCDDLAALEAALTLDGLDLLQLPLDVLDEARHAGLIVKIVDRGIAVFAREVVRLSPTLSPIQAIARACGRPGVTSCIVGTSNPTHLRAAVAAAAGR